LKGLNGQENNMLSPTQLKELEKRLEKFERGKMKFKSWDKTKASIGKRAKSYSHNFASKKVSMIP
jgi:Putative addiction module component